MNIMTIAGANTRLLYIFFFFCLNFFFISQVEFFISQVKETSKAMKKI